MAMTASDQFIEQKCVDLPTTFPIGMPFAQIEAKIILINILQKFTPQTLPGYQAEVNPVITLRPKKHLNMQLLPANIGFEEEAARWSKLAGTSDLQENADQQGCLGFLLSLMGLTKM